jgi:hypothetical protein
MEAWDPFFAQPLLFGIVGDVGRQRERERVLILKEYIDNVQ